jgi:hypothetical protein
MYTAGNCVELGCDIVWPKSAQLVGVSLPWIRPRAPVQNVSTYSRFPHLSNVDARAKFLMNCRASSDYKDRQSAAGTNSRI